MRETTQKEKIQTKNTQASQIFAASQLGFDGGAENTIDH